MNRRSTTPPARSGGQPSWPGGEFRWPLIVAHRGASAAAPENTLAAFRRAVEVGAEGIEFDVRLSADGVAAVIHDETLRRVGGRGDAVSDLTATHLKNIDVGSWFNRKFPALADPEFERQTVPTLKETLSFLENFPGRIYIELKCGGKDSAGLTRAVAEQIADSRLFGRIIIKCFELSVIPEMRRLLPGVTTAALFAPRIMNMLRKERYIVDLASEFGADELSLHRSLVSRSLTTKAHAAHMPVTVWTVDSARWVERARALGVAAVVTNDPRKLLLRRTRS